MTSQNIKPIDRLDASASHMIVHCVALHYKLNVIYCYLHSCL